MDERVNIPALLKIWLGCAPLNPMRVLNIHVAQARDEAFGWSRDWETGCPEKPKTVKF